MIKKNNKEVGFIYKNNENIDKIYHGTDLVFEQGFTREQTGVPPITTSTKAIGKDLKDYKIYGNSVQDGTPTPSVPVNIDSVGDLITDTQDENYGKYRIPLTISGKNLFNSDTLTNTGKLLDPTIGSLTTNNNYNTSDYIFIKAGTYTLSFDNTYNGTSNTTTRVCLYNTNYNYSGNAISDTSLRPAHPTYTFTIANDCYYRLSVRITDINIQIEKSSIYTEYEPYQTPSITNIYLNEPLRKIGDYADYIDFKNQKLNRKIKHEFIDTIASASSLAGTYKIFLSEIASKPFMETSAQRIGYCISNKFSEHTTGYYNLASYTNRIQPYITTSNGNRVAVTFDNTNITTVTQAQQLIGNGFDIYYVLDAGIEETITLPNIPSIKGTTIYSIETTTQPSSMYIKYKGK